MQTPSSLPFNPLHYEPAGVHTLRQPGGELILTSSHALPDFARCNGEWLTYWAHSAPQRTLYAERVAHGGRTVSYAEALHAARRIGAALLRRGRQAGRRR